MMMSDDISYCWAPGCQHTECLRHYSHLDGHPGVYTFSNFSSLCNMYERPVADKLAGDDDGDGYYVRVDT